MSEEPKPSDARNGCFLDSKWSCKVCDGELPDGHCDWCDLWKLEKEHQDFLANEYSALLKERDQLRADLFAAYEAGWRGCALWAYRDDLQADVGSPAYLEERDAALTQREKP